eukprot:CAMPEP_0119322522 /NCGR_PEP_ID=MMETSP1333-20130426/58443_1 /TAXON_ID=418940 /ORGANISM="Scyphosphaera apsteinii, Strain RCC1455" /LENGTH=307 /DNA_ID=CAMNT_0007329773 /DNA_START=401 /DNA_END=1324 /DNA_ORIENTATION=-
MTHIDDGPSYTAFLNAQGRILATAFLVPAPKGILIEAEGAVLPALAKHLKRYKLRSKVSILDCSAEYSIMVSCGSEAKDPPALPAAAWRDPRLPFLGWRWIAPRSEVDKQLVQLLATGSATGSAALYRCALTLIGLRDDLLQLPFGEALPLESNLEALNGVVFDKGCYLGQELTARTHFRGATRKRLLPVLSASLARAVEKALPEHSDAGMLAWLPITEQQIAAHLPRSVNGEMLLADESDEQPPLSGNLLDANGKTVGKLRSFDQTTGLGTALCRIDSIGKGALTLEAGLQVVPIKPSWWASRINH